MADSLDKNFQSLTVENASTSLERKLNRWGSFQGVQWGNAKVKCSAGSFSLLYRPNDPIPPLSPEDIRKESWSPNRRSSPSSPPDTQSDAALQSARVASSEDATSVDEELMSASNEDAISDVAGDVEVMSGAELARATLMNIPYDLVLCDDYLNDYSDLDPSFGKIRAWMENNDMHIRDVMTAFLCKMYLSKLQKALCADNPWIDYIDWLPVMPGEQKTDGPAALTLPTVWPESDHKYLIGTSLEDPLRAKMNYLRRTLKSLQEFAAPQPDLSWVQCIDIRLWIRFDACVISRVLDSPHSGKCMVACLDMANHSPKANARFDQNPVNGDMVLLRTDSSLATGHPEDGDEISIDYGHAQNAAESLMKYGFIDPSLAFSGGLILQVRNNDSLVAVRRAAFQRLGLPITVAVRMDSKGKVEVTSPFACFLALNEEHGLSVEPDGRVLWNHKRYLGRALEFLEPQRTYEELYQRRPTHRYLGLRNGAHQACVRSQLNALETTAVEITDELAASDSKVELARKLIELEKKCLETLLRQYSKQR